MGQGEEEIQLTEENIIVNTGGGAVDSVNGYTGDVVLTTSDLENTSNYQTGDDVANAVSTHNESNTAHSDIRQSISDEATNRENADTALQGQIDALTVSSDVVDVVGTYTDLQNYDTQHLKDNDIVKVLQDSTHNNAMSYYRWVHATLSWSYIGSEGPYYTKSEANNEFVPQTRTVNNKALNSDITLDASDVSAISTSDIEQSTGSSSTKVMSQDAITTALSNKQNTLTAGANISIDSNNEISATDTTYSDFTGTDGTAAGAAGLVPAPATTDAGKFLKADGTWDTVGGGGGGPTVVQTPGTSTTDVMSQNAVTSMVFADPATQYKIKIGAGTSTSEGNDGIEIGHNAAATKVNSTAVGVSASATGNRSTAIGQASNAQSDNSLAVGGAGVKTSSPYGIAIGYAAEVRTNAQGAVAIGDNSLATVKGQFDISTLADGASSTRGYNNSPYRLISGVYDGQSAHDAATVGQVNSVIDAINAALSTNIPHIGA